MRRDFLHDMLAGEAIDYLHTALDAPATEWLPVRYFAHKAAMSREELLTFVAESKATSGKKETLRTRLGGPDKAYTKPGAPAAQIQARLSRSEAIEPLTAKEARTIALAIIGLSRPLSIDATNIRKLLLRCLDVAAESKSGIGRSEIRKAIARLDELLSNW